MDPKRTGILFVLLCFLGQAFAQNRQLSGRVTAVENGMPIAGATVRTEDNEQAVSSADDGSFTLTIPPGGATLLVSSLGYAVARVAVGASDADIHVRLSRTSDELEDVVVVGYGTQRKATLTGSVSEVKGAELAKSPQTNVSNALAGRFSGVVINNRSGEPGYDGSSITVRGQATTGSNAVLVVVDGVPGQVGGLERLDPQDIESISVLKDASASIYGNRAANGVILVTTKRGRSGKPTIAYTGNQGFSSPTRLPKMADAATYATLMNEIAYDINPAGGIFQTYSQEQIGKFGDGSNPLLYPNTDWVDATLKGAVGQNQHNLSVDGGTADARYFLSLGTLSQDGIYRQGATKYGQYNFRANVETNINSRLRVGLMLSGRQENRKLPIASAADIFRSIYRAKPIVAAYYPNGLPTTGIERNNPAVMATDRAGTVDNPKQVFNGILRGAYRIPGVEGLSVDGFLAVDKSANFSKNFSVPHLLYEYDASSDAYNSVTVGGNNDKATLTEAHTNESLATTNVKVNFERRFGRHHVNTFVGYEQSQSRLEYFDAQRFNYLSSQLSELSQGGSAATDYLNAGYSSRYARQSVISRLAYDFGEKYLIEGQLRADGSSIFPQGKRWGYFPSVSAGWRISEERWFAARAPFFNELKLRASYGALGNDNVNAFQYFDNYALVGNGFVALLDGNGAIQPNIRLAKLGNPDITWEVSKKLDIGLNAVFFDRFNFEAIYFRQQRSDILTVRNASIPATSGIVNPFDADPLVPSENIGRVDSKGMEATLGYQKAGNFSWGVFGNFTYAKNTVVFVDEAAGIPDHQRQTGRSMNTYLLYRAIGLFRSQAERDAYPHVPGAAPGDLMYEDVNGDGQLTADDMVRTEYGNIPRMTYGLGLNGAWKNLDFSVLFAGQAQVSQYVLPESGTVGNFYSSWADNRYNAVNNPEGTYPRVSERASSAVSGGLHNSTFWLHNSAFLRLKNVEIGYALPTATLSKLKLGSLRLYANAFNLLTFTQVKDFDPEGDSGSGQFYPQQRIVNLGVNLTF